MKSKLISMILLTLIALTGCNLFTGGGEDFPPVPDVEYKTTFINNSSHKITINSKYKDDSFMFEILSRKEKVFNNEVSEGQLPFFNIFIGYVIVIYDEDITVEHTENAYNLLQNIMLESSYTGGKVNDKLYEIYYTFTDEDYEEAVALNGGG